MPSRKLTAHCPSCGCKNHLRAAHCNQCGGRLNDERLVRDEDGRAKLYADIAHPINSTCREMIQQRVIDEFRTEVERSKLPGYRSTYDDYDESAELPPVGEREPSRREAKNTHVQPAEQQPRSPHSTPAKPATRHHAPHTPPAQQGVPRDNFGAGIF
jgi:stage V sporulation protein G